MAHIGIHFDLEPDLFCSSQVINPQKLKVMSMIKFKSTPGFPVSFDSFFSDFFEGETFPRTLVNRNGSLPAANIRENEQAFHIELAAPGMVKSDFTIELNNDLLTVRSEKKNEHEEKQGKYTKREFNYTSFVRSFRLPEEVDSEKIGASYVDGVLKLDIPKLHVERKSPVRQIDVK
jgi:HSP20 family protein